MKSATRKIFIILIALICAVELFLPICGINSSFSIAASLSDDELSAINGKTNLLEGKYYHFNDVQSAIYRDYDNLEIYADSSDVENERAKISSGHTVEIYDGAELNIKLRNSKSKNYKTTLYIRKPDGTLSIEKIVDNINPLKLDYEKLLYNRSVYGQSTDYYISVMKEGTFLGIFDKQVHENLIRIVVKPNDIIFSNQCLNVNQSRTECLNGAFERGFDFENKTLLIRAGQPVIITSKDKGHAREYITTTYGGLDINGTTITAQNMPGFKPEIYYHCGGSSTRIPVVISNMSMGTCQITYGKCTEVSKKVQGYTISKNIGVKYNTNTTIKAVLDSAYNNCATAPKFQIKDMTNCLKTNPQITYKDEVATIVLNAKKDGVLKVDMEDRLGTKVSEYWYIYKCDNTQITNPIVPKAKQNTNTSTQFEEEAGTVVCIPDIPVEFKWYIDNTGNVVTYDVYAYNSTHTYFDLVKRANTNVPNSIYRNYNWKYGEGDCNHMKVAIDKTSVEDGVYDLIFRGENETGQYTAIIDTIWLGPSHSLKTPHIMAQDSGVVDEKTGSVTYNFKTEYCSEVKYKIIKRSNPDVPYDESILKTYDGFDGIVTENPNEFSIKISPAVSGGGYYDIVLYGINRSLYNESYIYSPIDIKGILVNNAPQVTISRVGDKDSRSHQQFKLESNSVDNDKIVHNYYYVHKKSAVSEIELPSADQMKSLSIISEGDFGSTFTSGQVIDIDKQVNGAGYYDIVVYSEDEFGTGRMEYVQNIMLAEDPKIEYTIDGEKDDNTCSISNRYVQNVRVKITDELVSKFDVEYCYTKDDITNDGKDVIDFNKFYNDSNYKVTSIGNINSGSEFNITLNAKDNIDESVYLYVLAKPQGEGAGVTQVLRTGTIRLDGTNLSLDSINADRDEKNKESLGYNGESPIKISLIFNHEIDQDIGADLYINIGNESVKQDSVEVNENKVTYSYDISGEHEHDDITIDRIDYAKAFAGKGARNKTYNENIKNDNDVKDLVSGVYFVDTKRPQVQSFTVEIEADEDDMLYDDMRDIQFISNFRDAKVIAKYDENIVGYPTPMFIIKGHKTAGYLYGIDRDDDEIRDTDIYDLAKLLEYKGFQKYEGDIVFEDFFEAIGSTKDLAGNEVVLPDEVNLVYKVNGQDMGNRNVVFDSKVYEPEVTTNDSLISENGSYVPNTEFKLFAEYEDSTKYTDLARMDRVELFLDYNSETKVYDCNDNEILPNSLFEGDSGYEFETQYILDEYQLPIRFAPSDNGNYKVKLKKKDRLGNTSSNEKEFKIYSDISIDKNESGFANINPNVKQSISGKTEDERTYNIAIRLENRTTDEIKVYRYNEKTGQEEELSLVSGRDEVTKIANYKLIIDRAGENKIIVKDLDGNNLLTDFIETYTLFIIGDTNFDGVIDCTDATDILRYIVKFKGYYTENIAFAGDINNDGSADISDVILLMRYSVMDPDVVKLSDGYFSGRGN